MGDHILQWSKVNLQGLHFITLWALEKVCLIC